ncbi:MAG: ATP-binding cassette domain-containing protein [Spirochaetales bacterium]|nr:MAG: ATP-binding cassette domain-containing protein [Spirochaetales bacterium]
MIEVKNLGKKYGSFEAVKDVSFSIDKGEIVGLLGPNGAGKTTIMKILTCYHYPSSGTAFLNGSSVVENALEVKRSIGYLPENAPLYTDLNVAEYLDFIADSRELGEARSEKMDKVIDECGLAEVLYKPIDKLSKGYKQRVGLAQAIMHDPSILILDEPTTGLDPNQIMEIRNLIRKLGKEKTVILSTHILQEVEAVCHRVLILNEGNIIARGTTEEIGRELKGDTIFLVSFKTNNPGALDKSLASLSLLKSVVAREEKAGGIVNVHLSVNQDSEAGESIFDMAVRDGHKILSMYKRSISLEDIFVKLTGEGGSNG